MTVILVFCCNHASPDVSIVHSFSYCLMQLVQPTFQDLLGHLRSGALENFKDAFEKALNAGEGFSSSADVCAQSCVSKFDKGCEGIAYRC